MVFELISELLKTCEYLKDFDIKCNMLDRNDKSVSVVPTGGISVVRRYYDGSKICGTDFDIILRINFEQDGAKTFELLEKFQKWLLNLNFDDYKELCDKYAADYKPVSLKITKGAYLLKDDIHTGRYKISGTINCFYPA